MLVNCNVIQDLLPLHLDGVSSRESSALVEEHLAECEQCALLQKKMAEKSSLSGLAHKDERPANPFRKLKMAARRTLIIGVAVTFVICAGLTACITFATAGYRGIGNLFGIDYDEVVNREEYKTELRALISANEMWGGEIAFISKAQQFSHDPSGNTAVFVRALAYEGQNGGVIKSMTLTSMV